MKNLNGLVLARKAGEDIVIYAGGEEIIVRVVDMDRGKVRIKIQADRAKVRILRREVLDEMLGGENRESA
jgi:carbon storage regulator CsrA